MASSRPQAKSREDGSYYALSRAIAKDMRAELKGYDLSTGTIRFEWDKPLPVTLVRKIVKARLAENAAKDKAKAKKAAKA